MCGRFVSKSAVEELVSEFAIEELDQEADFGDFIPSYNTAPSQLAAIIVLNEKIRLTSMRWGLIPSWAKDESIGQKLINARAETLSEKPSFRNALKKSRCLIPIDGFYEWMKSGAKKIPMFIHMKNKKPFALAGLYEEWKNQEGKKLKSFTIVTTEPNQLMSTIHNRMPVIVSKENYRLWLDSHHQQAPVISSLLVPYDSELMTAYEVSTWVNSPNHNSEKCILPVGQFGLPL